MKLAFPLKHFYLSFSGPFPFLIPIYEMLNVSMFPKDSVAFFKKFVGRMKENSLDTNQKVKSGGLMRGTGCDSGLNCEHVSCVFFINSH